MISDAKLYVLETFQLWAAFKKLVSWIINYKLKWYILSLYLKSCRNCQQELIFRWFQYIFKELYHFSSELLCDVNSLAKSFLESNKWNANSSKKFCFEIDRETNVQLNLSHMTRFLRHQFYAFFQKMFLFCHETILLFLCEADLHNSWIWLYYEKRFFNSRCYSKSFEVRLSFAMCNSKQYFPNCSLLALANMLFFILLGHRDLSLQLPQTVYTFFSTSKLLLVRKGFLMMSDVKEYCHLIIVKSWECKVFLLK